MTIAISIDGELVEPAHATISVLDRGLLYGDGLFEVLRTWSAIAVDLPAHLDRLYASAAALGLRAIARGELERAVERTLATARSDHGEHRIRIVLTRGPGALSARTEELGPGRAIVIVEPLFDPPTQVSCAVVDWPLPRRPGPAHKTLAYLDHVIARDLARAVGADEALRLDADGFAVEGATSNLHAIVGGAVVSPSPSAGALPGVVRRRVLAAAARLGLAVRETRITVDELRAADELFVSSSVRGVVPITRLDGVARIAGPTTARIAAAVHDDLYRAGRRTETR